MKFTKAETNENYPMFRATSENGVWEVGFCPVMFGVRVKASRVGDGGCAVDYCAGDSRVFQAELLVCIINILETFDETLTPGALSRMLPSYERKPINQDPCWVNLCELRDRLTGQVVPEQH